MAAIIRHCPQCQRRHHFPRDMASYAADDSNWQIAADTIGGLLLGAGVVIGFVWLVTR